MNSPLTFAPLRSRLRLAVVTACVTSLFAACAVFFAVQFVLFRSGFLVMADSGLPVRDLLIFCADTVGAMVAATILAGIVISNRFSHLVTEPLRRLAGTVRNVVGSGDYSVRAEKLTDDELGSFADSFNEMLAQIQSRDEVLRHEIAEGKRAKAELETVHAQLLEASRQAGMAEVATGVLHNVGNVLNSVNVSANVISEKLNLARFAVLQRTAHLLRDKGESVGEFLGSDPRGRLIPAYLCELAQHLADFRREALVELELLMTNIEHIKEIVSMQQNYARVADSAEPMRPDSLVEDALRMTAGSRRRRGVEVVRMFETTEPIFGDRHKVLQILVNLIRNSQDALCDAAPAEKRITIRIHSTDAESAAITVTDNGIGIPPENLTRIFSHGFTTRKDGHGFGLHSAALAAQQMGGCLSAHSDGPGRGATFSIELPLARMEVAA